MRRLVLFSWLLLAVVPATAQDEFSARATVDRRRITAMHAEDPTAAGTSLDLLDRVTLPRSLGDVVREAPGARVQSTGALGAFASVSLRGADGEEVMVMLDEIPLVTPDGGAFDLSLFAPELFERIDVFRGGAPVWLGSGAIGGVLRLVPRRGEGRAANLGVSGGSFGSYQVDGGASVRSDAGVGVSSQAVLRGARNDYSYLDDGSTRFDPSDDQERLRTNAELTDASGLLDLSAPLGPGRLHFVTLAQTRTGGFPGPGSQPTPNVHRQSARGLSAVAYEGSTTRGLRRRYQVLASASYNLNRYSDRYAEFGNSQRWETDDQAYRAFLRAAGTLRFVRWLEGTVTGSYAVDRYDWENSFAFPKPAPSTRHTGAVAAELRAHAELGQVLFELRPSVRLEASRTLLHADRGLYGALDGTRDVLAPTARLGAALEPYPGVALNASASTGTRLPTLYELFGDRAAVLPAPGLGPVTSTTYEAGITLRGARGTWTGSLEAHVFRQQRQNAIVAKRTAQYQLVHQNEPSVEQLGGELGLLVGAWKLLSVRGSATYLDTANALDKRLPFRPRWVLYARPEARFEPSNSALSSLSVASETYYRSFVYADDPNLAVVGECLTTALTGALGFLHERLRVSGRLEDVGNARCTDLTGYPLPGRSGFVTVSLRQ